MYRDKSYEEELAQELQNPVFAKVFLLTLMEGDDGLTAIEALKHTIRRMGIKEFAHKAGVHADNISRMLSAGVMPKLETLNRYFSVFDLKIKIDLEDAA